MNKELKHKIKSRVVAVFLACVLVLSMIPVMLNQNTTVRAATSYYVSASDGNNAYDGTHDHFTSGDDGPFLTIQKGIDSATNAGDTINIREGTYRESVNVKYSGSAGNPITITNYQNEMVYMNGTGSGMENQYALINLWTSSGLYGRNYITIQNINFVDSPYHGIRTLSNPPETLNNITVHNCTFTDIMYRAIYYETSNTVTNPICDMKIDNCTFNRIVMHAYPSQSYHEAITFIGIKRGTFRDNTIYDCPEIIIDFTSNCTDCLIYNNTIDNDMSIAGNSAIYVVGSNAGDPATMHSENITVSNNKILNHQGSGITLTVEGGGYLRNITISNNIVHTDYSNGINVRYDASYKHQYNITIKHNTVYLNTGASLGYPLRLGIPGAYMHNFIIANNIFCCKGGALYTVYGYNCNSPDSNPELHFYTNLYYRFDGTTKTAYNDKYDYFEGDAIKANPEFVSKATHDFHLNKTSPAINEATSLYSVDNDCDGNIRPIYNLYDIGAYEYNGGTPVITTPSPSDTATGVSLSPVCSINATDNEGDTLNVTWYENHTGSWIQQQINSSVEANHTYLWTYTNASINNKRYWWKVVVDDGYSNSTKIYSFTTTSSTSGDLVESTEVIEHNLGTTPNFISITLTSYPNSKVFYYVDSIDDDSFALHMLTEPGVTVGFTWRAEKI